MDPFKFEDNFATAVFAGLTARGIPHGNARADAEVAQERVEFTASGFHEASAQMVPSAAGVYFRNHYAGTLAFGVLTQVGGNHAPNHNVWVSNVRSMLARPAQFFDANNLPCYTVLRLSETAGDLDEEPKTDTHHTRLTYLVEVAIDGESVA